jgi:hypothetical protein
MRAGALACSQGSTQQILQMFFDGAGTSSVIAGGWAAETVTTVSSMAAALAIERM